MAADRLDSSFRDPSGYVFRHDGVLYRCVRRAYAEHYDALISSGLYARLCAQRLMVAHDEVHDPGVGDAEAYRFLRPQAVPFISYPYEWCFSQLQDAALATLQVQRQALAAGLTLKDASAYNIQFVDGAPVLIDTLSFEHYREGQPWVAYRQFCEHFLAPLALMAHRDIRLGQLLRIHIDGVPIDLASTLLPARTRLSLGLMAHVHAHAAGQRRATTRPGASRTGGRVSKPGLLALIGNLEATVRRLSWRPEGTVWADYYSDTNYSEAGHVHKRMLVQGMLERVNPRTVWDLGANDGRYSRLASQRGSLTVSTDFDPAAVEKNYRTARERNERGLLPLIIDLANPSPALGWAHRERSSFLERGPADLVMALALMHHLAIANNVPFGELARFFAQAGEALVIEFVPKTDSQVQRLLAIREDVFSAYTQPGFEAAFDRWFRTEESHAIADSQRTLYLMRRR